MVSPDMTSCGDLDPLAAFTTPPPNETPEEKAKREKCEAKARRVSYLIDDKLFAERTALQKQKQIIKILLLGQSESGKSTLLKNFQMRFAQDQWMQERPAWRAVLQLNLIRSVNGILQAMQDALDDVEAKDHLPFMDKHHLLQVRLSPLLGIESDLKQLIGVKDIPAMSLQTSPRAHPEFDVQFHNWQSFLQASRTNDDLESCREPIKHNGMNSQDITEVISNHKDDILALWTDSHEVLQSYRIGLEDTTRFFLDNIERLAAHDYEPTDDDILRARLRILGIQEYELNVIEAGNPQIWKIYVVGDSRTQPKVWLSYFEQVNAVIFLAPASCFDQRLNEDPRVNCLEASFTLWKAICSSKFLKRATLIILLNEVEILEKKLKCGVMVNRYIPSYGDRPNDTQSVVKYLHREFKDALKRYSTEPRMCHIHPVSATDARTTEQAVSSVLHSVREGIIREHLANAQRL